LTLLICSAEGSGESILYEDAGNGFGYERGEYARRRVVCEASEASIFVRVGKREGTFIPQRGLVNLELRGVRTRPQSVTANHEEANWRYEEVEGKLTVSLKEDISEVAVEIRF